MLLMGGELVENISLIRWEQLEPCGPGRKERLGCDRFPNPVNPSKTSIGGVMILTVVAARKAFSLLNFVAPLIHLSSIQKSDKNHKFEGFFSLLRPL
jgi:hypothetical protein